jgi:hypothetical protein
MRFPLYFTENLSTKAYVAAEVYFPVFLNLTLRRGKRSVSCPGVFFFLERTQINRKGLDTACTVQFLNFYNI